MGNQRSKLIVGNWKMHGSIETNAVLVAELLKNLEFNQKMDVVLCPPSLYLQQVRDLVRNSAFKLGAQNLYYKNSGAYTGEISASMLKDIGCQFVIVGHSERREYLGESDDIIARKFLSAYDAGVIPILCIGESELQRRQGEAFKVVEEQLQSVLDAVPIEAFHKAVIAYEPVWAIGTGLTAKPEQAEIIHQCIRDKIASKDLNVATQLQIIYGGSVNADNAAHLFEQANIDGALIGGASLKAKEFSSICQLALDAIK